ncbi:DEAD/DEAH box helicase [Paenibacillus sp. GCM10023252]|uniref:DEAD/DEAH box helicase n=1 Tax=Paenibacillus sp. GCM10023252 TaxID=3252649 RepID=UPI0036128C9F
MKANVYAVEVNGLWQVHFTIEYGVDRLFWLDAGYRDVVMKKYAEVGAEAASGIGQASVMLLWVKPLPLGDAIRVKELWEEAGRSMLGWKLFKLGASKERTKLAGSGDGDEQEVQLLVDRCMEQVEREAADRSGNGSRSMSKSRSRSRDKSGNLSMSRGFGIGLGWIGSGIRNRDRDRDRNINSNEKGVKGNTKKLDRDYEVLRLLPDCHPHVSEGEEEGDAAVQAKRAEGKGLAAQTKRAVAALQGRALLRSEAHALLAGAAGDAAAPASIRAALQLAARLGGLRLAGAVAPVRGRPGLAALALLRAPRRPGLRCQRCGSGEAHLRRTPCAACGRLCAYCSACLTMGRSRECELLVLGMPSQLSGRAAQAAALHPREQRLAQWGLSPAQTAAAGAALQYIEELQFARRSISVPVHATGLLRKEQQRLASLFPTAGSACGLRQRTMPSCRFLLWAVTGAGKTEMIFPLIESILLRGGRALLATPRRDVVLELDPRLRRSFPSASVVTLYGGSKQRWETGQITLATTHQLMRFRHAFDLVIIDELDAFPYHGDPILHYTAQRATAPEAVTLLLSATPPADMQREARRGALPHARVPVRFHRRPLPVPKLLAAPSVAQMLLKRRIPRQLIQAMQQSVARGAQLFVFVQRIAQVELMAALLREALRLPEVASTSSTDPDRAAKVQRFRNRETRVLVTTTILERGVTIPKSDVYILDAGGKLFDEASLVQMAGRAGRSADDPYGRVYFCSRERTKHQISAVRHIRSMNRLAARSGYLLP